MKKTCLVILSHSSYSDIWDLTLKSYSQHLSSSSIDLFITSDNNLSPEVINNVVSNGFNILYYPDSISWSDSLRYIINNFLVGKFDSVIFSFDDLVIIEKIDNNKLVECIEKGEQADYIILNDGHKNIYASLSGVFKKSSFFDLSLNDSYLGSLVFSLWNVKYVHEIINLPEFDGLNPWQYEVIAYKTLVNNQKNRFIACKKPLINFSNLVIKGKILKTELTKIADYNNVFYEGSRERMNSFNEFKFIYYKRLFKLMRYILPHSIFKKIRKSY